MKKFILTIFLIFAFIPYAHSTAVQKFFDYGADSEVNHLNLNGNFNVLVNWANGGIDNVNLKDGFNLIEVLSALPVAGEEGRVVYRTTDDTLNIDNGSAFVFSPTYLSDAVQGDVLYFDGTIWTRLTAGTSGNTLSQGATIPSWAALNLAGGSAYITGVLPSANGGISGTSAGGDLTGTYPNPTLTTNVVANAQMEDDAIHTAELYTDTGSQSGTLSAGTPTEITMNAYSFFPNIYAADAESAGKGELKAVNDNTDSQIGRFAILSSGTESFDAQWRYVKASDPERWIFAVYSKIEDKIQHIWESGDHPFMTDPDAFPNPFEQFVGNSDYEIYLIDNEIWNELKQRITRNDRVSRIILNEYEVDKVSVPTFKSRTLVEFDEWEDRSGEIIKTYKNKTAYGKTKTLKQRVVNELPIEIKHRKLKKK